MDQSPRDHEPPEADGPNDSTANNPGATRVAKPDESRAAPTTAEAGKNAISKPKTRRLVVCIDGTSNQFSDKNTNVVELYSHIKKDHNQLTYYNSGIGTYARPSWRSYTYMKQVFENLIDLAIAWNLEQVIIGAYRWLSDTYQPGDQIFLFGFSRGAYQVRALAGMIHNIGLLHPGNQEQIPFAWELYAKCDPERKEKYRDRIDAFKTAFSRDEVDLHFLGAWDTVSSVGIFRGRLLPLIKSCEHVTHFRHALALDERRVKFLPEYVTPAEDPDRQAKEVWFAGTHSDMLASKLKQPLIWMLKEARKAGLDLLPHNKKVGTYSEVTESLSGIWWLLELFPLSRVSHQPSGNITTSKPHCGRGRKVLGHHKIHWSVLANYKRAIDAGPAYEPKSKLVLNDGIRREWKSIFEEQKGTHSALWEGDLDLIEALSLIKGMGSELQTTWLDEVLKYVTEPGTTTAIVWYILDILIC
ncbi:hypothetical protein BDV93DRAFT_587094 [Ceratobasidium sp. AG-I]|nr:hypothetical protein BDV93DRAFT_587094 [Ceratobasidium sp. AG-I]